MFHDIVKSNGELSTVDLKKTIRNAYTNDKNLVYLSVLPDAMVDLAIGV